jgi:general secretion pathway protein G
MRTTSRRPEPLVFFPWEKRRGLVGAFGRRRAGVVLSMVAVLGVLSAIYELRERSAAVRATRATITTTSRALYAYRADHGGACPRKLSDLATGSYVREEPLDAWGRPLRLTCPGRKDPIGFDLSSDGPDGVPGGLDRVESSG